VSEQRVPAPLQSSSHVALWRHVIAQFAPGGQVSLHVLLSEQSMAQGLVVQPNVHFSWFLQVQRVPQSFVPASADASGTGGTGTAPSRSPEDPDGIGGSVPALSEPIFQSYEHAA
jgi:hypothetical protein